MVVEKVTATAGSPNTRANKDAPNAKKHLTWARLRARDDSDEETASKAAFNRHGEAPFP